MISNLVLSQVWRNWTSEAIIFTHHSTSIKLGWHRWIGAKHTSTSTRALLLMVCLWHYYSHSQFYPYISSTEFSSVAIVISVVEREDEAVTFLFPLVSPESLFDLTGKVIDPLVVGELRWWTPWWNVPRATCSLVLTGLWTSRSVTYSIVTLGTPSFGFSLPFPYLIDDTRFFFLFEILFFFFLFVACFDRIVILLVVCYGILP